MLTGNCFADFQKWYVKFLEKNDVPDNALPVILPLAMRFGVLLEFFREQGIHFEHQRSEIAEGDIEYAFMVLDGDTNLLAPVITAPDYNTALTEAIRKANELVNGGVK